MTSVRNGWRPFCLVWSQRSVWFAETFFIYRAGKLVCSDGSVVVGVISCSYWDTSASADAAPCRANLVKCICCVFVGAEEGH